MNQVTTKRLLSSLGHPSEFLVPDPDSGSDYFRGISSGQAHQSEALSYIGKPIGVQDILGRMSDSLKSEVTVEQWHSVIETYLLALQEYKIGNVLGISTTKETCLRLLSSRPNMSKNPKSP